MTKVTRMERTVQGKAFLVGVEIGSNPGIIRVEESLDELAALVDTAGSEVVGQVTQRISKPHPDTLVGSGKLEEIRYWVDELGADVIIFDDELSPRHQRELERFFGADIRVIDRTVLILDIFAQHARSKEGSLQVSLAQYEYRLPRLTRMWTHLARQAGRGAAGTGAGGLGLRGPGETQLETDRREIRRHISHLKRQLARVREQRRQQRRRRSRNGILQIALVGYTNAGKSTLLNALSGSSVLAADKLFATLDPTTRRVVLSNGQAVLFSDTVGFIQKLPHQLIAAFRATLEEVVDADILIHVADVSHPQVSQQIVVVEQFLASLRDTDAVPTILVLNKSDQLDGAPILDESLVEVSNDALLVSASTGAGIDSLLARLVDLSDRDIERVVLRIPYAKYHLVAQFYDLAGNITQSSDDDGIELCGNIRTRELSKFDSFVIKVGTRERDKKLAATG